ncbi:4Fe-4S binding protein [archaeon]|jgi:NAD-dependent dihydropyrimidine dehydrogenase PreA subunit|nr:4Fe-4S binding protein [Candidatus Woesearchaeota archaeon]MBT4136064.1 4Fe-4S binding protein [archaeon]MBT4241289.1 4Fe-4S binding protein [archaeon]MBT4418111.1 4Fe-4S binding protein [archaeon]
MKIKIDYEKCCWKGGKCQSCGCGKGNCCNGCVEACPVQALERKDLIEIDHEKCIECGACIPACEHEAINFDEE